MKKLSNDFLQLEAPLLSVFLSFLLFLPIAFLIQSLNQSLPDLTEIIERTIVPITAFRPERAERYLFIAALLFFPISISFFLRFLKGAKWSAGLLSILILFGVSGFLLEDKSYVKNLHGYLFYLQYTVFDRYPVLFLMVLSSLILVLNKPISKWLTGTLVFFMLMLVFLVGLYCENDPSIFHVHLNVIFYPIQQVLAGNSLGVEINSQYGFFPFFLKPVFYILGLSILKFTLVMSVLNVTSLYCVYLFLKKVILKPHFVILGFSAVVSFCYFHPKLLSSMQDQSLIDLYFQYWPIRTLFPLSLPLFLVLFFRKPSVGLYRSGLLFYAVGCLWNVDSGVPTFLTLIATLCFGSKIREVVQHIVASMMSLALVLAFYFLICRFQSGQFPDFSEFLAFQNLFYMGGFFMLPMPFFHLWNWVLLIYLLGLAIAFREAQKNNFSEDARLIFALSILGLGCFSYYQGRSHDLNLPGVMVPAVLLSTYLLDRLWNTAKSSVLSWGFCWVTIILHLGVGVSLITALPDYYSSIGFRVKEILKDHSAFMEREKKFLSRLNHLNEEVLILSEYSMILHLLSGTRAPATDLPPAMLSVRDYQKLMDGVEAKKYSKIIVHEFYAKDWNNGDRSSFYRGKILESVLKHYQFADQSHDGKLILFTLK